MKLLRIRLPLLLVLFLLFLFILRVLFLKDILPSFSFSGTGESVVRETISSSFITPYAQLLEGFLFGMKVRFPPELYEAMKKTGTLHMVVASGYNVTVVAGFCMLLAGLVPRKAAIIITGVVLFWYASFSHFDAPVVRASIMGGLTFFAQLTGRLKHALWSLFLTAFLMLFIQPLLLQDIGFQLSFAATLGILLFSPLLTDLFHFVFPIIREDLAVTVSAQLATAPLLLYHFGSFSPLSLFANLAIFWVIPAVMLLGGLFLATAFVVPVLSVFFQAALQGILSYVVRVLTFFSILPFSYVTVHFVHPLLVVGLYLCVASLYLWLQKRTPRHTSFLAV